MKTKIGIVIVMLVIVAFAAAISHGLEGVYGQTLAFNPIDIIKDDNIPDEDWVLPGGIINYTIEIYNSNSDMVHNVTVIDDLSGYVSFVMGSDDPQLIGNTVVWEFDNLTASETKILWLVIEVDPDTPLHSMIMNTATVACDEAPPNMDFATTCVATAPLTFEFGAPRDETFYYYQDSWMTGITDTTLMWINTTTDGCYWYWGENINNITYTVYWGSRPDRMTEQYTRTIEDNHPTDDCGKPLHRLRGVRQDMPHRCCDNCW